MRKILFLTILILCSQVALFAQPKIADKIVAQVGENIILKSDIEAQYMQDLQNATESKTELSENYRCILLEQFVAQKLLLIQAEKDSVVVSDDQVDYELDRRIRYFESVFGGREKMEEFYGKSVQEMKEEFRTDIMQQLLVQTMQEKVFGDISISPSEVKTYFNTIPKDSLPYFNAEVEISQIVLFAEPNAEQKEYAKEQAQELLDRIKKGADFNLLASSYSKDPGSSEDGGFLGCTSRGSYVTEFEAAAFNLKPGEVSEVIQTQFGYHIIKMESRQGDNICLRHILITPPVTNTNVIASNKKLDSIRTDIVQNKISFYNAAVKYSMDNYSNLTGGEIENPQNGTSYFGINELEPEVYYLIEKLKPGEISSVTSYTEKDGKKGVRILLLKSQTDPHVASLETDYSRIQVAATTDKKYQLLNDWVYEKVKTAYINIDEIYFGCDNIISLLEIANEGR